MFRSPQRPQNLVMVMDTHPLSDPKFAPSYHYEEDAVYRFNFSTNGQGVPTSQIDFVFSPIQGGQQTFTAHFPSHITVKGTVTPGNVTGPSAAPIITSDAPHGISIFAGPREDPFVFDLVGFNRLQAGQSPNFTGNDSFSGFNVNAIVVEVPIELLVGHAPKFTAWGVTYLGKPSARTEAGTYDRERGKRLFQIDRMGNPVVNTVLITSALKDSFNVGVPQNDAKDFAPTILNTLKTYGTNPTNIATITSLVVPDTLKYDLSQPDGYPNGRLITDRAIDTVLSLVLNKPVTDGTGPKQVLKNYLSGFPFLGPPCQAGQAYSPTSDCVATAGLTP